MSVNAQITLVVVYSDALEECRDFYTALGLDFVREQHGRGPEHYAAELGGRAVFEIYPANGRQASTLRLGLSVDGASARPPLEPGRSVLTDPDGRKVDVQVR